MTLAIKNYTTKVDVHQSLGEIQGALGKTVFLTREEAEKALEENRCGE